MQNESGSTASVPLSEIQTPALLLDLAKLDANSARLKKHLDQVAPDILHRPHLKTAKSLEIAEHVLRGREQAITVSTLREAEIFARAGFRDILYAVGIVPSKLARVAAVREQGADLKIITDNADVARRISEFAARTHMTIPVLIEIDCDGHRSGLRPAQSDAIVAVAKALTDGAELAGVMTHAGGSYDAGNSQEVAAAASGEVAAIVQSAQILRDAGYSVPIVSIGSTPTALSVADLSGVTEIRAGVYMFFDLVMAGLGICRVRDIALSVLTTVIGHQPDKGWIIVDAGWMAMSRDRGTASQDVDQGYGLVCDPDGQPIPDLIMESANQEHGIIAMMPGSAGSLPDFPVGSQLRILPNHACSTAAQHGHYDVLDSENRVIANWQRFGGW
ncbi:D-serine deaminase, pyridoxal phosphate-dependent [Parasphingorhabdus marina DSM 22363]|uniref:D-serine deaminase, pyridoxal phosphate-dependent n=1 Tax=Parasphingorhabdus marina DSM 22363 TaxID=1123272 RepID=A0A1N6DAV4_9SPHN|nr:alanine racemase [Parasphingorhabdus marina]SIN67942.1 D-serine deaminase, pyridoxal phosphate-dependent [Parasphingorhabdus marina DSM 22363]